MASGSKTWSALSLVAAVGSAALAKKALNGGWKVATGKTPPENPADPDVDLWEAVLWASLSGTAVALVKMLATRKAATYFTRSTGHLPPGLAADGKNSPSTSSDAGTAAAAGI